MFVYIVYCAFTMLNIKFNARIGNRTRMITLLETEAQNQHTIVGKIFESFALTDDNYVNFSFANNLHAPINADELPELIAQYKGCGCFFVEILLDQPALSIRAESIRNWITDSNRQSLIDEYNLIKGLSDKSKRILSDCLYEYLKATFTTGPSPDEISDVCKAALTMFPSLKVDPSEIGGIDDFYNPKIHKGMLYHKIKNAKTNKINKTTESAETENSLKSFFKYCVVNKDKTKLKEKLRGSIDLRRKLLKEKKEEFIDFLSFYFVEPDLILFDFGLLHPTVDDDALRKNWDSLHSKPLIEYKNRIDFDIVPTKDTEVWRFLTSMYELKQGRTTFPTIVKSLFTFSENPLEDPMNLMNEKSKNPYIIGVLSVDKKRAKYYIDVNRILVSVPDSFDYIAVIDIFFKIHIVFDLPFHANFKQIMAFLERYVYQISIDEKLITEKMRELALEKAFP